MNSDDLSWTDQFKIQSAVDLDFVIGQEYGRPIGMQRTSPPEFRRRVLAAGISHQLGLRSIDYALKRYVEPGIYEDADVNLGDSTSDYLCKSAALLEEELRNLHTVG